LAAEPFTFARSALALWAFPLTVGLIFTKGKVIRRKDAFEKLLSPIWVRVEL